MFKSKLLPAKENELLCIGGPLDAIDSVVTNIGAQATVRYLNNFISNYSTRAPKIDFFPNKNMDEMFEKYGDKTIPGAVEYLSVNDAEETEQSLNVVNLKLEENLMTKSDEVENSDDEVQGGHF